MKTKPDIKKYWRSQMLCRRRHILCEPCLAFASKA